VLHQNLSVERKGKNKLYLFCFVSSNELQQVIDLIFEHWQRLFRHLFHDVHFYLRHVIQELHEYQLKHQMVHQHEKDLKNYQHDYIRIIFQKGRPRLVSFLVSLLLSRFSFFFFPGQIITQSFTHFREECEGERKNHVEQITYQWNIEGNVFTFTLKVISKISFSFGHVFSSRKCNKKKKKKESIMILTLTRNVNQ